MKKSLFARVLVLFVAVLFLAGCFDVTQHVTRNDAGMIVSFVRFSFDKSLFSITEQMGGEAVDYDEMLQDADLTEDELLQAMPPGVTAEYQPVNTPARFGFSTTLTFDDPTGRAPFGSTESIPADSAALEAIFFPYLYQNGVAIPFEGIADADEESEPFLAASIYALSVGKRFMTQVNAVHVVRPGAPLGAATRVDAAIQDYEDYFLIEIPMSSFIGEGPRLVVIQP